MKSLNSVIIFFAILAILGAGIFFFPGSPFYYKTIVIKKQSAVEEVAPTAEENVTAPESKVQEETSDISEDAEGISEDLADIAEEIVEETDEAAQEVEEIVDEAASEVAEVSPLDVTLTEKSLGSDEAPITVYEYSSLSCGHCGAFHSDIYPEIKSNFIETGKVRLVMIDFPLNLPAMQGAKLAHCLPDDQYFNFLQLLFTTQRNWLMGDYEANLKQNAQLAGLSAEEIDACLNNEELEKKLVSRMEDAQAKWNVSSTPSFVINNGETIIEGNRSYDDFAKTFNEMLSNKETTDE